jgi:hypothetical protein
MNTIQGKCCDIRRRKSSLPDNPHSIHHQKFSGFETGSRKLGSAWIYQKPEYRVCRAWLYNDHYSDQCRRSCRELGYCEKVAPTINGFNNVKTKGIYPMEVTTQTTQSTLGHKCVGDIRGIFFVPRYQRGYRWDTDDVQRLLDDIQKSGANAYSLQPVVVKCRKNDDDKSTSEWELIDGQQRLTTLHLIFLYMQKREWKKMGSPYSISYETRPDSAAYLGTLDPGEREKNIDYFHLYQAYECIDHWFKNYGDDFNQEKIASKFHQALCESVRVIWYEVPADIADSTALFTRLNVGRIPLTDAELVKALMLTKVREKHPERAQELAAQWDSIERDLRSPDVWAFVAGVDPSRDADKYPTRISLLLDTLANSTDTEKLDGKHPRYYTFDTLCKQIEADVVKFWNKVIDLHALILGWFATPSLYNKIGFLVVTGTSFGKLVKLSDCQKKSEFDKLLVDHIRDKIKTHESDLLDLSYENKRDDSPKLLQLLLLMNVEAVSRTGQNFPFFRHLGKAWSLEHIHAQDAENLTKIEQWKAWLVAHKDALLILPDKHDVLVQDIAASLDKIDTARNFSDIFRNLSARVVAVFDAPTLGGAASEHGLHSISNLALLSSGDNSALSNAVFEVKRQLVLDIDRNMDGKKDSYIPICTRNVFLKYYTGADAQQIHFWSPQDRHSYFNAIVSTLKDYFKTETNAEEAS